MPLPPGGGLILYSAKMGVTLFLPIRMMRTTARPGKSRTVFHGSNLGLTGAFHRKINVDCGTREPRLERISYPNGSRRLCRGSKLSPYAHRAQHARCCRQLSKACCPTLQPTDSCQLRDTSATHRNGNARSGPNQQPLLLELLEKRPVEIAHSGARKRTANAIQRRKTLLCRFHWCCGGGSGSPSKAAGFTFDIRSISALENPAFRNSAKSTASPSKWSGL